MSYLEPVVSSENPDPLIMAQRFPGCLPRTTLVGSQFPMAADRIDIIPSSKWDGLAKDMDLSPHVKVVLDQGSVGSCATEAIAQGIMISRAFQGLPHIELNPLFIYHTTSGGRDRGSSIDANLRFVQEHGIAPVSAWSRDEGWKKEPHVEAYKAAQAFKDIEVFDISNVNEMVSALLLGMPVIYGANGHAVVKVKHIDSSKGLDINSWGDDWGNKGFGVWASYRATEIARYGAYAIRAVR